MLVPSACEALPAVGVWEDVTPPSVDESTFGVGTVVVDPNRTATIYLGTSKSGLFKSLDCGAHWVHVDTGTLGADIDKGSVGPVLDPVDTSVLYTGSLSLHDFHAVPVHGVRRAVRRSQRRRPRRRVALAC